MAIEQHFSLSYSWKEVLAGKAKCSEKKNENDCLFTYLSNFLNRIRNRSLSFCKNPQGPKFVPKITQEIVDQIVAKIAPKIVPFKISFLEKYVILKFIYSEKATQFWEIFPLLLTVCTEVKSKWKISQNFVAFSEYINFISHREQAYYKTLFTAILIIKAEIIFVVLLITS